MEPLPYELIAKFGSTIFSIWCLARLSWWFINRLTQENDALRAEIIVMNERRDEASTAAVKAITVMTIKIDQLLERRNSP